MKLVLLVLSIFFFTRVAAQNEKLIITDTDRDLIPEGIAIDQSTGNIYVSSINRHTIIITDKGGKHRNFIQPGQDGFKEGLGLKVDDKRQWLWALSVYKEGKNYYSGIHAFELKTGKTMQQYHLWDTVPHLFNDLVITPAGDLLITDTYFSAVYKLDPVSEKLAIYSQDPLLRYPNGLVLGNNYLYVATYSNGLLLIDTTTRSVTKLKGAEDTTVAKGLDGLVLWKNSLIGVFNIGEPPSNNCIIQYQLSKKGDRIIGENILVRGHSTFADPTTAAPYNNEIYVIANSHLDAYNKNKTSTKGIEDQLKPVTLLIYPLEKE